TPSAAAELVSPNSVELVIQLNETGRLLAQSIREIVSDARERVKGLRERMSPRGLRRSVEPNREQLELMHDALSALTSRDTSRRVRGRPRVLPPLPRDPRGFGTTRDEARRRGRRAGRRAVPRRVISPLFRTPREFPRSKPRR